LFQTQVRVALDIAEPGIRALWPDPPPLTLEILRRDAIPRIVAPWGSNLAWDTAVRKCRQIPSCCFIGVQREETVSIVALLRVSRSRLHTSLLFLEKDTDLVPRGLAMTIIDQVLDFVASVFQSERIVLDNPLSELVSYYKDFGYEELTRHGGRDTPALFRPAGVR
jgi:hypothetical protein